VLLALPRDTRHQRQDTGWSEAIGKIRQDQKFNQLLMSSVVIAFVFMQMSSTFGVHVTRLGFSAATYGTLISMNGAMVVLCELPLTTITRRFPARRILATGYCLIGTGFAMNAWARSVPELAACIIIFTLGEMIAMPVSAAYVSNLAPAHMRGRYMGVYGLNWGLALIFAPGLGMKMLAYNPTIMWLSCGGLGLLAAMIISANIKTSVLSEPAPAQTRQ
jgi:MFS family permease